MGLIEGDTRSLDYSSWVDMKTYKCIAENSIWQRVGRRSLTYLPVSEVG